MQEVKDKKIVVLGAARSGIAVAQLLKRRGADVFVSDRAHEQDKHAECQILKQENIKFEFGGHSEKIYQTDLAVLSPGIPSATEQVIHLQRKGIPLFSELEVASWFCRANLIAVTGSNGKTTTTTLLAELLKERWPQRIVAGNIGTPLSAQAEQSLADTWGVVEVSSFQLEHIDTFHPSVVVLLNVSPNHLDRYPDYQTYVQAKLNILKNLTRSDHLICNRDDSLLYETIQNAPARKLYFSATHEGVEAFIDRHYLMLKGKRLMPLEKIMLKGRHNYMNCMAAVLAAEIAGIMQSSIIKILTEFRGVEHRLEHVGSIDGITFINDSKSTTIDSLRVALMSYDQTLHLIVGGKDKGSDFSALSGLVKDKVSSLHIIGEARRKIYHSWHRLFDRDRITMPDTLQEAVMLAYGLAGAGEVVLFSPACASFDMFRDYEQRGEVYKSIIAALKGSHDQKA
jgi:UDP-N-acetylmuramoylalanine--D-glutamate ligase